MKKLYESAYAEWVFFDDKDILTESPVEGSGLLPGGPEIDDNGWT